MKILLVALGTTARAHCLAEAIASSASEPELVAFMPAKNPGVLKLAKKVRFAPVTDLEALRQFARETSPDLAVISPDDAVAAGCADALIDAEVPSVGPLKSLARLESSKSFTRALLAKHGVPGSPGHKIFTQKNADEVPAYLKDLGESFVVKPDGLTGGKGVKVSGEHLKTRAEGAAYVQEILKTHSAVVIEEKLEGEEFSIQYLTDGRTVCPTPAAQDHKRAFENDEGPNTGGMGSYSFPDHSLPFLEKKDLAEAKAITEKTAAALKRETGLEYKGVMYGGFMKTAHGTKLIEYNARFGDPEVMNVLPIIESDFADVCEAITAGTLNKTAPKFKPLATVCKYAVPQGYPTNPVQGQQVDVSGMPKEGRFYFGSVESLNPENTLLKMGRSRAIACVGIAPTIGEAEKIAEKTVSAIKGPVFHRRDIATKTLLDKRVEHVKKILSGK